MIFPAPSHTAKLFAAILLLHNGLPHFRASAEEFEQVATIVNQGIDDGEMSGAVVVVADQNRVLYQQAFGDRQVSPAQEPMTIDTVFDLASLTKPIATATSVICLVQSGELALDDTVATYLPEFGIRGKESITIRDLLLHVGGMIPDNAIGDYQQGVDEAWTRICKLTPIAARGEKFIYSDVGYIALGKVVERVSGKTLDQFCSEEVFRPLRMTETMFNPTDQVRRRTAATEKRDGRWMKGEVHDPRAALLGGVAGHAGLFSTANDLVRFGQMMLGRGTYSNTTVLNPDVFAVMTKPQAVPRGTRTIGWDHRSPYSTNRGDSLSDAAFGHGGFTGTVMWIDPAKDRVFVFLSNRLHPDGQGSVNKIAGQIATIVGENQ